jgi:hypothetical protein
MMLGQLLRGCAGIEGYPGEDAEIGQRADEPLGEGVLDPHVQCSFKSIYDPMVEL